MFITLKPVGFFFVFISITFVLVKNFQKTFSPFFGLATQNHFLGKWVVVNNISLENIGSEIEKNKGLKIT